MNILNYKYRFSNFIKASLFIAAVGCVSATPILAQTKKTSNLVANTKIQYDSISGVIINGITKRPIAGARIESIDKMQSAMSDENGAFSIKLARTSKTILVSAPDYDLNELTIYKSETKKNIQLFPKSSDGFYDDKLTIFGLKRSTEVVDAQISKKIENTASITIDNELQKKLAGDVRVITHSGTPGIGSFMLIRGINSLNSNVQPLIVIDGVVFDNQYDKTSIHLGNTLTPLSNIDVNDIEHVSVIKDGTTLYGSKGGNGVLLITTNRGKSMTTKITASATVGYNNKPNLVPMMNADQYRVYLSDLMLDKNAQKNLANQYFLNDDPDFIYYNNYHNNTNWKDGVYANSTTQSYNVGVNGGDESALYNLSMGYTMANSTLKSNNFNRLNARFNSDIKLSKNFNTSFDISYSQMDRDLRNDGVAESYTTNPIDAPGYLALIKSPFLNPYQFSNDRLISSKIENYDFMGIANPYAILEYGVGHTQQANFNLVITPQLQINKKMSVMSRFSYNFNNLSENFFRPMYGVSPFYNASLGIYSLNQVKTQFAKQISIFNDTRFNWKSNFGFNSVDLNAGVRYISNSYSSDYASGNNTGSDQIKEMSSGLNYKVVGGVDDPYRSFSLYATANYSYKDRYFVEPSLVVESSSRFASDVQSGFKLAGVCWAVFPSVNASWIFSSENFMKNISFVNKLKLRAGYGLSGNDDIRNNAADAYLSAVSYASNAIGLQLTNIGNPTLQWETNTKRNVGLDANLFNNRLQLSVDLYNNTTDNLLVKKNLNILTGLDTYWSNDGKLQNKGFEFSINTKIIQYENLQVEIGASLAHYANKILALANGDYSTTVYDAQVLTAIGQSIGQFYGYKTNGVYATAAEAQADGLFMRKKTGELIPFEAGDVRFVNNDASDKVIDEKDKVVIGNSNPDFYGLINAGVKYKMFSLKLVFNYTYGNEVYNYLRSQIESANTFSNQSAAVVNRWINEGQQTNIPKSVYLDPKGNNRFSDRWLEDGSFLRLKNIELAYEVPVKNTFLQGLTVWASATNLWTFTKYLGQDPEFSTNNQLLYQGIDTGLLPQSKSFFMGLKIYL